MTTSKTSKTSKTLSFGPYSLEPCKDITGRVYYLCNFGDDLWVSVSRRSEGSPWRSTLRRNNRLSSHAQLGRSPQESSTKLWQCLSDEVRRSLEKHNPS